MRLLRASAFIALLLTVATLGFGEGAYFLVILASRGMA